MPGTWAAAVLAGLPHLMYALSQYLPDLLLKSNLRTVQDLAESLFQVLRRFPPAWWLLAHLAPEDYWSGPRALNEVWGWAFALLVLVLVLLAGRRRWPRWSATALGYGLLILFETSLAIWRDDAVSSFSAGLMLIGYIVLMVWLARRDPLASLLCILPLYPMFIWWTAMDGVRGGHGEGLYYIFIGLVMAAVVALAVRQGSLAFGLEGIAGAVLILGLGVSYATVFYSNMPSPPLPTPGAVLRGVLGGLVALAVISLPLWLTLGWGWARRRSAAA